MGRHHSLLYPVIEKPSVSPSISLSLRLVREEWQLKSGHYKATLSMTQTALHWGLMSSHRGSLHQFRDEVRVIELICSSSRDGFATMSPATECLNCHRQVIMTGTKRIP